jgi:non-ribosomal peptide synthetase-like protein
MNAVAVPAEPIPAPPGPFPDPPFARDELLHEVFAATAERFPDRCAVRLIQPNPESPRLNSYTYRELRARAARFAHYLRQRGVRRGDRVLIWLPRSLDQYMAVLGVLEAGAAYVPVDWSLPPERVMYIAEESEAFAIVTEAERCEGFPPNVQAIVPVDAELGDIAAAQPAPLTRAETGATPDDLAYLIYTSGSTGRPKGVMIRHRNICFQIRSEASILGVTEHDRVFAGASLSFDVSVEEMWAAFLNGGELLVGSETLAKAGPDVAQALDEAGVTIWCPVPSLLAVMDHPMPHLRLLNVGGEACPQDLVNRWAGPGRRMLNTYGPTETSVACTWTEMTPGKPVTIGKPLPGFLAWVVDENLQPRRAGEEGELVIAGPAVGAGYLHREELTAEKFVTAPFPGPDGEPVRIYRTGDLVRLDANHDIEFLGRIDTQVKLRGYRIELGEIESVLSEDPAVAQAVVNLYGDPGDEYLAAHLAPRRGTTIDLERIRAELGRRLPAYMHPQVFVVRASLPLLVSGKVDRKALPAPTRAPEPERVLEPPAGADETALLAVWRETFGLPAISVTDDFFLDLDGHSLRAARMVSLARAEPTLASLSIQDLYAAPTIRSLAQRLAERRGEAPPEPLEVEPFHPADPKRRAICVVAQTVALVPIFALNGLQWLLPYLVYIHLSGPTITSRLAALGWAGVIFVVMPPVILLFSVAFKWLVIGRYKPGDYPLWGAYYFRWWLVRRVLDVIPTQYLAGTPGMRIYYRLLGADIGRGAFLNLAQIDAADLVSIGAGAVISEGALLATTAVERGLLRIGRVDIGARAVLGSATVVGRDARVGEGAVLEDLTAVAPGAQIPAHEVWNGSPAVRVGPAAPRKGLAEPGLARRAAVTVGLILAAALLPIAAVLPIAPGLIAMIELDWASSGYSYLALSPALALVYILGMCALTVAAKWLLLGRVKPGVHSVWSGFYIRFWFTRQLNALALELLHPIYATLYVAPWYRAMGARIGRRAEISTATSLVHDLIDIGQESFIADGVMFGGARFEPGAIRLASTRIGRRTFAGNSAVIPAGSDVGDDVLIGVLSKPPPGAAALESGSSWFGCPAIRLPRRQIVAMFNEGSRFKPGKRLYALRLAIEYVRVTLPLTIFVALFSVFLSAVGELDDKPHAVLLIAAFFPALYIGFALAAGLSVIALKWLVIGRYKPTNAPLWSLFVWRSELVTSTYENLAVPLLLEPLRGTPWLNVYLRLMGSRIGKRVFCDTTDITEHDLVSIGDDAALNENAGLQTHLFEDRIMKVSAVDIGARATVGSLAIALYDTTMEAESQLGDLSVLMKGERLPAKSAWEGSPAQPARS